MGLESHDALLDCIQTSSSPRDLCIPQRGDSSLYRRGESGAFEHPAYDHISDGVYGGILEKLPPRGIQFCHPAWNNIIIAKPPREYTWQAKETAKAALRFLQKDLRHHIGPRDRADRAIYLDRAGLSPIVTIKCDEGGWENLEWLLSYDLLWCHHERQIGYPLSTRDNTARRRELQNRLRFSSAATSSTTVVVIASFVYSSWVSDYGHAQIRQVSRLENHRSQTDSSTWRRSSKNSTQQRNPESEAGSPSADRQLDQAMGYPRIIGTHALQSHSHGA